jgi:hypothetical protein
MWGVWAAVCAATWATNARTPPGRLYGVAHVGVAAAAGRVLVLLGWPIALAAIGLMALTVERLLAGANPRKRAAVVTAAWLSIALCCTIALPGVIEPAHLEAKPSNIPAALGTGLALALTFLALRTPGEPPVRTRIDRVLLLVLAVFLLASIPWMLANVGIYAGDIPGIRAVFMSKQVVPEPHHLHLRAVHLGNHDGFDGLLLAVTAVVGIRLLPQLRSHRLQAVARAYLCVLVVYGLAVATADFWLEQIVKRGWIDERMPGLMRPNLSLPWIGILAAALALNFVITARRPQRESNLDCASVRGCPQSSLRIRMRGVITLHPVPTNQTNSMGTHPRPRLARLRGISRGRRW